MPYHLQKDSSEANNPTLVLYIMQYKLMSNNMLTSGVCISQLLADHSSISAVPEVMTHCPPLVIDTHLHSTLILIGASHQTNITIGTGAISND